MARVPTTDEEILLRLDVIARLLLSSFSPNEKRMSVTNQIFLLKDMGLSNSQMATLVGKGANYVGATLSRRKGGKKK